MDISFLKPARLWKALESWPNSVKNEMIFQLESFNRKGSPWKVEGTQRAHVGGDMLHRHLSRGACEG